MKVVKGQEMKKLDQVTMDQYGVPGLILMENAGIAVVREILKMYKSMDKRKIHIVCGRGNNGGDGFVVARHLYNMGIPIKVWLVGNPNKISGDAKVNYNILTNLNLSVISLEEDNQIKIFRSSLENCDLIIDALLGTGLTKEVMGIYREVIDTINQVNKKIISIDIPSGICADSGAVKGTAIKAHKTITLQLPKIGNINYPGGDYCGELLIKPIGIPDQAIEDAGINVGLITKEDVQNHLPKRKYNTHKGTYGKAYMLAGSTGMTGAAMLAGEAVLRSGAGILKLAVPQSINDILEVRLPEVITVPLPEIWQECVRDREKLMNSMEKMDVITIGPGCGQSKALEEIIKNVINSISVPLVLDADALNILANKKDMLKSFKAPAILTPHPAEMARLTGLDVAYINHNRIEVAQKYAKEWNVIIVLKGAKTIIAEPGGKTYINTTGNPGMATGGSGDVLTGIITGLLAQGISPFNATCGAVYLHGLAGDRAAEEVGQYGMTAGDILKKLPKVIKELVGR